MNNYFTNRCSCPPFIPPCPPPRPLCNATVTVGSTTTLEAGQPAYVTNTGTLQNAILNFGIPTGATGATGPQGEAGEAATITVGTVTALGVGETPTVTNSGTSTAAVLDFGIPTITQGDAVADLETSGTLEDVITTVNALLASLRTAGVIATAE